METSLENLYVDIGTYRVNGGSGEWQNLFAISRFFFVHYTFYYYWGKENYSLYRGLRYIGVRYIEVRYIEEFVI